jgi:hypothetical protein
MVIATSTAGWNPNPMEVKQALGVAPSAGAFLFLPDGGMAISFSSSLHPESIASCSFLLQML